MSLTSRTIGTLHATHESRKYELEGNQKFLQVTSPNGKYRSQAIYYDADQNIIHFDAEEKFRNWKSPSCSFITAIQYMRSIKGIADICTFSTPATSPVKRLMLFHIGDYRSSHFGGFFEVYGADIAKSDSKLWVRREHDAVGSTIPMAMIMRAYVVLDNKIDRSAVEIIRLRRRAMNKSACDPNNEDPVIYWTKYYTRIRT